MFFFSINSLASFCATPISNLLAEAGAEELLLEAFFCVCGHEKVLL